MSFELILPSLRSIEPLLVDEVSASGTQSGSRGALR